MRYAFPTRFIFSILFIGVSVISLSQAGLAADVEYIPGTRCPMAPDEGLASFCGTISSSMHEQISGVSYTNLGIGGATIALYEAVPNSTTGKIEGKLGNLFDSGQTTRRASDGIYDGGQFHLNARRIGPPGGKVYLVIFCDSKFDVLTMSSTQDLTNLTIPINCPGNVASVVPPPLLDFTNRTDLLGCTTSEDTSLPVANYSQGPTDIDLDVYIENFDNRHCKDCLTFEGYGILYSTGSESQYSKDCEMHFDETERYKCYPPGTNGGNSLSEDEYAVSNHFPFVSYDRTELAYSKLIVRRSDTGHYSGTTKPIGSPLHQMVGSVSADKFVDQRLYGQAENEDDLLTCDYYHECNSDIGQQGNPRNSQMCGGWAARLSEPYLWEDIYNNPETDLTQNYCYSGSTKIKLCEVKPVWETCTLGDADCEGPCGKYKLDSAYFWAPYLLSAGSGLGKMAGQTKTDSFTGVAPRTSVEEAFRFGDGNEAIPQTVMEASNTVLPDDKNELGKNSVVRALRVTSDAVAGEKLAYMYDFPYAKEFGLDKPTGIPIGDLDSPMGICSMSYVAAPTPTFTADTELGSVAYLLKNSLDPIAELYPGEDQTKSKTAEVGIYYTSASWRREQLISADTPLCGDGLLNNWHCAPQKILDGILNACAGSGAISIDCILSNIDVVALSLFAHDQQDTVRIMGDGDSGLGSNPDLIDSLVVAHPISEENFTGPTSDFPAYGEDGYPGNNACYPWKDVPYTETANRGHKAYPGDRSGADGLPMPLEGNLRTLKVDKWYTYKKVQSCECAGLPANNYVTSCDDTELVYVGRGNPGSEEGRVTEEQCLRVQHQGVNPSSPDPIVGDDLYDQDFIDIEWLDANITDPDIQPGHSCPNNRNNKDFEENGPHNAACDLSFAESNVCSSPLYKDATFKVEPFIDSSGALDTDSIGNTSNMMVSNFSLPYEPKYIQRPVTQIDSRTTAASTDPVVFNGKEVRGYGGSNAKFSDIAKLPVSFDLTPEYVDVTYYCQNPFNNTGWECPFYPVPEPIDLASFEALASSGCPLGAGCGVPNIAQNLSGPTQMVLNAAAASYDIPASVLVAAMYGEGSLGGAYSGIWATADYDAVGIPWYSRLPVECDDLSTSAEGPFGWLSVYFSSYKDAVEVVSVGRGETASRCNFLDAAFAAAKALSEATGNSCGSWTQENALTAIRRFQYGSDPKGIHATDPLEGEMDVFNMCR